ncbi:MAG: pantoate--beta-alanine ligase [Chloroflexi bacterium]|nr:MAG: pantoate--beta-alanine ligase [Chloroflexota bacterium]
MRALREELPEPVGFVPTMGALHEGHLALVRRARSENESVIVSIFVNPTQFGPQEDFATYPRDFQRDLNLLRAEGVDVVFAPEAEEMYPPGFSTWVEVEGLTERLEGAFRPGHFRGVATVVAKLFNITSPTRAYFGQKDAQQALVLKRMVADLNFGLELIVVPTVREPDGLAMSSRNVYLTPEERRSATILWRALSEAKKLWEEGERDAERLRRQMRELIQSEPRAQLEYVSVADAESLEELSEIDRPALVSLAVRLGRARLIDNITLG